MSLHGLEERRQWTWGRVKVGYYLVRSMALSLPWRMDGAEWRPPGRARRAPRVSLGPERDPAVCRAKKGKRRVVVEISRSTLQHVHAQWVE